MNLRSFGLEVEQLYSGSSCARVEEDCGRNHIGNNLLGRATEIEEKAKVQGTVGGCWLAINY